VKSWVSRRRFLQSVISAPLAAGLGSTSGLARAILIPSARAAARPDADPILTVLRGDAVEFPQPGFIRYDAHCFTVNDRDTFLFGAAFHYPRCPQELWRDRLVKLKTAGFNVIDTCVFWNYHEPEEGRADLSEFEAFVQLVGSMGFKVIVRPGPYVCAEWDAGGFPHWVIARRFPLRSNHPESVRTSEHWFGQVLPVIARHQVTHSGPIILMQIENEYDYWQLPDDAKREYLRSLAHTAWSAGIDIPLITCWTAQVRDRQDPDFSRMLDTCNFYPRWNVTTEVPPALAKLRREQPDAPEGISQLQGGWFSGIGGKLAVDQDGVDARQLELLSKTAIEQGATHFNYYMGCGGTNFDWAAKKVTTTYDYAAPLREPGGVWEKYYAARRVGASLRTLGGVLTRAEALPGAARSSNPQVSVSLRVNGKSGVVFIRENGNGPQRYQASFQDPNSPTHRLIAVPREGELELGPREMKMLPVQIPLREGILRYSTAEVLVHARGSRPYVVLYDKPGRLVEFGLSAENEPHIEGDTVYQYWDEPYESVVAGVRVGTREKMLLFVETHLVIVVAPRDLASKSWAVEMSGAVLPGALAVEGEATELISVPFFTDAALVAGSGRGKKSAWMEFDFAPGEHEVNAMIPPVPSKFWLNGVETDFRYDRHWETFRFQISTPKLPVAALDLTPGEAWVERFDPSSGAWVTTPLRPLEELGPLPYGYVKYLAEFSHQDEPRMFISAFADDAKKVFVNGKLVPEASRPAKQLDFALAGYAHAGANRIEIAYELFGSPNFGEKIAELKGIEAVRYGSDLSSSAAVNKWQLQRFPAAMRGRRVDPEFAVGRWSPAPRGSEGGPGGIVPAFTWCRMEFNLPPIPEGWSIPWRVIFEAERDALLYLNGRFVGHYALAGPQTEFYLPAPYLLFSGKARNLLTVVLAYTDSANAVRALRVSPYEPFATHRERVEFEW
jgi:Glycosyl hydrolases family 35/Beta-galactosidase, domain 2